MLVGSIFFCGPGSTAIIHYTFLLLQAFKDVHLVGVIAIITGVGVFMLILGSVIPQLRPNLDLATSAETPQDRDVCLSTILLTILYQ